MIRTQIQLPDEIYEKAKKIAAEREISLAELARRGLEYMLRVYTSAPPAPDWQPPQPKRLGWKGLDEAQLKQAAQATSAEIAMDADHRS